MGTYLVQYRVIDLNRSTSGEPDEWSSARSTITLLETSAPLKADTEWGAVVQAASVVQGLAFEAAQRWKELEPRRPLKIVKPEPS